MEVSGKRLEIENLKCVPCHFEGVSTRSDGYCKECIEFMCHSCFQHHLKSKFCRNHVFSGLDEKSTPLLQTRQEEKCKKHKSETIKYYCRHHDFVGCADCIILDHSLCIPETISNIAKQLHLNSDLKDMVRKIKHCGDENTEMENQIQKSKQENQLSRDSVLDDIRKFRKEINSFIDKIELEIVAEADQIAKDNEMRFANLEKKIASVKKEIADVKSKIDPNVYQDDSLFIRLIECKPGLKKIEQMISEIKAFNCITLVFEAEQKLIELMESGSKLGKLHFNTNELQAKTDKKDGQQTYTPPDPRAAGFDVGVRVYRRRYLPYFGYNGTVQMVDPAGYVTVRWDNGKSESQIRAGAEGVFDLLLLSK